jgi:hypothetical protein
VPGGIQLSDGCTGRLCAQEAATETVCERPSASQHSGGETEAAEDGLKVFGANGGLLEAPRVRQQSRLAIRCDRDCASDGINQIPEIRHGLRRAFLLLRVAPETAPAKEGESDLHVPAALRFCVCNADHVVDVHGAVKTQSREDLNHLAREAAREGGSEPEAEREAGADPVGPRASSVPALVGQPLCCRCAAALPSRGNARILDDDEALQVWVQRAGGEVLGQICFADPAVATTANQTHCCVDALHTERPARHAIVDARLRQVDNRAHGVGGASALERTKV